MEKQSYREVLGQRLKEFRLSRSLSMYAVAQKGGIRTEQVKAIEEGNSNYTIDIFLGYIVGADLFMYFAEKDSEKSPDLENLIIKAKKNIPR